MYRKIGNEMAQENQSLLMKTIDRLENTINSLSTIANTITYEMQSTNFKIAKHETQLAELASEEDKTGSRIRLNEDRLNLIDRTFLINTGKLDNIMIELADIKETAKELKTSIKSDFVTKDQFSPIQKIVYMVAGFILTAVIGAIINVVIHK